MTENPRGRIAESRRNRATLLAVAARSFAANQAPVPLESIAREAGVGIGTLYRHFPTREALVAAVYEDQLERLGSSADELLAARPPLAALRAWMEGFAEWAATKQGMVDSLRTVVSSREVRYEEMRTRLTDVLGRFLVAGRTAGDIRPDADPVDVAAMLAGVLTVAASPEQAARMLDMVADSLRPGPAPG